MPVFVDSERQRSDLEHVSSLIVFDEGRIQRFETARRQRVDNLMAELESLPPIIAELQAKVVMGTPVPPQPVTMLVETEIFSPIFARGKADLQWAERVYHSSLGAHDHGDREAAEFLRHTGSSYKDVVDALLEECTISPIVY